MYYRGGGTIKPSQFATRIGQIETSTNVVNGIIEKYKAESGTIDANTFVEFVNKYEITAGTDINALQTNYSGGNISTTLIDKNKVFVAHPNGSNYWLNAMIVNINNETITFGNDITVSNTNSVASYIDTVLISPNRVLIAYGSTYTLNLSLCTINGNTINIDTSTTLSSASAKNLKMILLDINKVLIAYDYYDNLYGVICNISNDTITSGTDTQIVNMSGSARNISIEKINQNKVIIIHTSDSSYRYTNGIICNINGNTITPAIDTTLISIGNSGDYSSILKCSNDTFLIVYKGNNAILSAAKCYINNNSITIGTQNNLTSENNSGDYSAPVMVKENKIFIPHQSGANNNYLNGIVLNTKEETFSKGSDITLVSSIGASQGLKSEKINDNEVLIVHPSNSSNKQLNFIVCDIEKDTIKNAVNKIEGLTKDETTTSTAGDVWVLDN